MTIDPPAHELATGEVVADRAATGGAATGGAAGDVPDRDVSAGGLATGETVSVGRAASAPVDDGGESVRGSGRRLAQLAVLAVPIVVLAVGTWSRRALFDDAFINLRVVSEVLAGHGPVFNPGQRVEAVTSPLWLWVLVGGGLIFRHQLEWMTVLLDMALSLAGVALLMAGSAALYPREERSPWLLPIGALALVSLTPTWTYSASGLENGLTTAWLGACLLVLGRWARGRRRLGLWGAVVLGLGPLVRPEFAPYSLLFLAVPFLTERASGWPRRVLGLAAGVAAPTAYELFRMGYYGMVLPNSAVAKSATGSRWGKGWGYVLRTFDPYLLWLPLAVLLVGVLVPLALHLRARGGSGDRRVLVMAAFVVGGLVNVLLVVKVGGDYMHARLLLPAVTALLAPAAVVPWNRRYTLALVAVPWSVLCIGVLRSPGDRYGFFVTAADHPVTVADFNVRRTGPDHLPKNFARPGFYLGTTWLAPPGPGQPQRVVALYGTGLLSYALGPDTRVVDLLGLGDPLASHLHLAHRGLNSHEKPLPLPWLVARDYPAGAPYLVSAFVTGPDQAEPLFFGVRQLGNPTTPFPDRVAAARKALTCGEIRGLAASTEERLSLHRFLSNVLHAVPRTFETFPPEPADAIAKECR